ncbi:competence type IV pilus minor pilin ComGD [Oceanobacillus kapialis]|uniref:competence type IV pilus minor pilin ComGD n=1 Tax=Oceanobacillus kapialis TaxID=481353 RepID=UPI00384F792A
MKEDGFTLIEMLVVLSMLSVMALIAFPLEFRVLKEQQEKQFLNTLASDVMNIQQRSTISTGMNRITFYEDSYLVRSEQSEIIRDYPDGLTIDTRTNRTINFNHNGNIKNPRTLFISGPIQHYRMVFPFGKGRFYLEKQ